MDSVKLGGKDYKVGDVVDFDLKTEMFEDEAENRRQGFTDENQEDTHVQYIWPEGKKVTLVAGRDEATGQIGTTGHAGDIVPSLVDGILGQG
ncbi:MAG: hypothetical protein CMO80_14405 [Verrucomicrobiales bacterium]|nr:hypothetical protein [Verrucomicrobiales bacterium]